MVAVLAHSSRGRSIAGLARLARAAKDLDDMYAFVEDVDALRPEVPQPPAAPLPCTVQELSSAEL